MNHKGTKYIETQRLILRPFVRDDAACAYRNWMSDDEVTRYLRWATHKDISVTEQVLEEWIAGYARPDFYQWAIVLKSLGEPIGTISVVTQDERTAMLHIGYCIGRKWWRQGYTSEAFAAVIPFLFYEVGANRIESQHDPNNPNSGSVMKKCGLIFEGTLRQADVSNQGIVDVDLYSLLREEYKETPGSQE